MRYLLLIYEAERSAEPDATVQAMEFERYNAFTQEVRRRGLFEAGEALENTSTATTVRVRDGKAVVTDGPFAETKELLGGFYLLNCANLDEAIDLAKRIPAVERGSIEIRPIWEYQSDRTTADGAAATAG